MKLHKVNLLTAPVPLAILTALCLWWLGPLVGQFSAQVAALYELQAILKKDAVLTTLQGI
ncbi:hypothetical protein [Sinorhizobium alkalisoli]|uniref:hypothetical protein n=1 Tax=Sinorhizobium alkalisoli TaxID=1752398 RepID=UPI001FD9A4AE|nr:hypothetical protein [Sinorhizobium alkalisoli]